MTRVVLTTTIDAPVDACFDFITDPRNNPQWQQGVTHVDVLDDGPMRAGTRAVEHRQVAGRDMAVPFTVTRYERPTLRAFEVTGGAFRPRGEMRFTAQPDGATRVEIDVELRASGPAGLLTGLLARALRRRGTRELDTVKRLLERPPLPGATLDS